MDDRNITEVTTEHKNNLRRAKLYNKLSAEFRRWPYILTRIKEKLVICSAKLGVMAKMLLLAAL